MRVHKVTLEEDGATRLTHNGRTYDVEMILGAIRNGRHEFHYHIRHRGKRYTFYRRPDGRLFAVNTSSVKPGSTPFDGAWFTDEGGELRRLWLS